MWLTLYLCLALLLLPLSASAQELSASTQEGMLTKSDHMKTLIRNCLSTEVYGDRPDAPLICACGAGYMAAALPDKQYAMIALFSEAGLDQEKMTNIMSAMVLNGVATKSEVLEAAALMVAAGEAADKVCIAADPGTTAKFLKNH